MKLKGYYSEEELAQLKQDGKITWLQYVEHHDEEMTEDFRFFCKENHIEKPDNDDAIAFLECIESRL